MSDFVDKRGREGGRGESVMTESFFTILCVMYMYVLIIYQLHIVCFFVAFRNLESMKVYLATICMLI